MDTRGSVLSTMVRQAMSLPTTVREQYRWMPVWDSLANCDVGWVVLRRGCCDSMEQYQWRDWNRSLEVGGVGDTGMAGCVEGDKALEIFQGEGDLARSDEAICVNVDSIVRHEESEVVSDEDDNIVRDSTSFIRDVEFNTSDVESDMESEEEKVIDTTSDVDESVWCEKCSSNYESSRVFSIHDCVMQYKVVIKNSEEALKLMEVKLLEHNQSKQLNNCGNTQKKGIREIEDRFKCHVCDKQLSTGQNLRLHMERIHSGKRSQCSCKICGKHLKSEFGLLAHMEGLHNGNRSQCPYCDKSYSTRYNMKTHSKRVHGQSLSSNEGHKEFVVKTHRKKEGSLSHMEGLHNGNRSQCPYCEKSYSMICNMKTHSKRVHGQSLSSNGGNKDCVIKTHRKKECSFSCQICGRRFQYEISLKAHMKGLHNGNRSQCPLCEKSYSVRPNMLAHARRVHNTLLSTENKRIFAAKASESHSEQETSNVKGSLAKIMCDICSYSNENLVELEAHRRSMHKIYKVALLGDLESFTFSNCIKDPVWTCGLCGQTGKSRLDIFRHIEAKHVTMPYFKCGRCQHYLKTRDTLRRHMMRCHRDRS